MTGTITFRISCAKRKNEVVEMRQFTIKADSLAFRYLHAQLSFNQDHMQLRNMKYKAASTEVERLSVQSLQLRKEQATAYCFRHAFSGDLHVAGLSKEKIAQCLGHATDKTQNYYSHSGKDSSGSFKIENISSTESVKCFTDKRIEALLNKMNSNHDNGHRLNG